MTQGCEPATSSPQKALLMIAYIVLILAALSRFVPHALHGTGMNFTAVGAGLLFFGSRRSRWQAVAAVAILAATDFYLTRFVYGFPFQVKGYLVTWAWYAAVCLLASGLLRKVTVLRVVAGVWRPRPASSCSATWWSGWAAACIRTARPAWWPATLPRCRSTRMI